MTKSDHIMLTYTNGEDYILFSSFHLDEKDKKQKGYVYKSAKDMEKESPNLKDPKIREVTYRNFLNWIENGKRFQIETNSDNPLTKEDLIKLAKTMVKK